MLKNIPSLSPITVETIDMDDLHLADDGGVCLVCEHAQDHFDCFDAGYDGCLWRGLEPGIHPRILRT